MKRYIFIWIILSFISIKTYASYSIDEFHGEAIMRGYIVATPCSIETDSLYQYINYDYISNYQIDSIDERKKLRKPFYVKLNNCISEYDINKYKGIKIQFLAPQDIYSNSIMLSGPKSGVVVYIYDINDHLLMPNKYYPISATSIYFDKKTQKSILKYETELNSSNNEIEPGDYFTTIKFNVTYD